MDDVDDDEARRFVRRTVVLDPGTSQRTHDGKWRDALDLVERGEVDRECAAGGRRRFSAGAVLWLTGIDIRLLHNAGTGPVELVAVTRRRPDAAP